MVITGEAEFVRRRGNMAVNRVNNYRWSTHRNLTNKFEYSYAFLSLFYVTPFEFISCYMDHPLNALHV